MTLNKDEAGAELAAIDDVVRRVKQSRIYRVSGDIAMMWGVMQFVQYAAYAIAPARYGWTWIVFDGVGVALTLLILRRAGARAAPARAFAVFALFYAFGFVWSGLLGHFGARETSVFWHTLFLFGYSVAGVWFGLGFLTIGLGLTALILAVYLFAGPAFPALIALVAGLGYIVCGYWMRRA